MSETHRLIEQASAKLLPKGEPASADPAARLKLVTAAVGLGNEALSVGQILAFTAGLPASVSIDASGLQPSCSFPGRVARIVLNLLLLASDSLPSGGSVMLAGTPDDLFLRIDGAGAAWPTGMAACVASATVATAAITGDHDVRMPFTILLAREAGIRLSFLLASSDRTDPPMLRLGGG